MFAMMAKKLGKKASAFGTAACLLAAVSLCPVPALASAGGGVSHIAAIQMYIGKFLGIMFTYSVPGYVEGFAEAEKYMVDETGQRWREWYSSWLNNAGFTKSTSEIQVGQVIVSPRKGPGGEIRARVPVVTRTSILGKGFESSGTIYVTLLPVGEEGYGVGIIRHESDEGGLFEVSPSGVKTKSAIGEQNFNRMVLDAGS